MVRSEVDTRGEMEQFILRPSQLRPQCGRNWIHPIELSAALQLPHSESTTIQRLYFFRQITDDVLAVVRARPIGGLRLLDHDQADDKIIAVLKNDAVYGHLTDIDELPKDIIRRLIHYFTTYKDIPGENSQRMKFISIYGQDVAKDVILRSMQDYQDLISEKHLAKPSGKKQV